MGLKAEIYKDFGDFVLNTAFEAEEGVIGILGASGCGKSMTLRCIAGIVKPDRGHIELNGKVLFDSEKKINLKPQDRNVGLLFQNYALFPNMNLYANLRTGILPYEKDKTVQKKRISEMIDRFYLNGLELLKPSQLSGGQQQRAALARILLSDPQILMLDEPFSALDGYLRWKLELELMEILQEFPHPTLLVSHSRDEVYRICDRVCVMNRGKSSPVTETKHLFEAPQTKSACLLTGCKNYSKLEWKEADGERRAYASDYNLILSSHREKEIPAGSDWIGIRSHYLHPVTEKREGEYGIDCTVRKIVEDVFSMVLILDPIRGTRESALRMEITKEEWNAFLAQNPKAAKELKVSVDPKDILFLKE